MGAENSVLHDGEWGDTLKDGPWEIKQGTLSNETEISLFCCHENQKKQHTRLRSLTKHLRSKRHPCILHYIGFEEGVDGPLLMTERVVPLTTILDSLSSIEICAGLQSVLEGLAFLHNQAGVSHNNVHLGAVYVSSDGSWRVGSLDHSCKFSAATAEYLESCRAIRHQESISPEEKEGKISTDAEFGHTRDVYALAVMTEILLEKMEDLGDMTKTFELRIQDDCLSPDPKQRPNVQSLLNDRLFKTEFLEIASFLKHITLKSEDERKLFFRQLLEKLLNLPEDLIGRRLVPSLLSRFVMLDQAAIEYVLPSLLTPYTEDKRPTALGSSRVFPLLSESVFKQFVVPKLVKVFCVHDYTVHVVLLTYFPQYVHLIDKEALEMDVFPVVLLGLRDASDQISALSLHALAEMVPILGRDIVIGGKSKTYFKEGRPKHQVDSQSIINNRMSNVQGMMGKKVLLKDIAQYSETSTKHSEEEKDRRWKEREKKREEMKKRREERKLTREKENLQQAEAQAAQEEVLNSNETVPSEGYSIQESLEDSQTFQQSISDVSLDSHMISELKVDDWSDNNNGAADNTTNQSDWSKTDKDKDDWSDWDNKEGNSDISDEIEQELQNMTLEHDFDFKSTTTNAFNEPEISTHSAKHGMKLKTKTPENVQNNSNAITDLNNLALNLNPSSPKSKLEQLKTGQFKNIKNKKSQPNQLGSEFDIKSMDITVPSKIADPFDFFSDMTPTVQIVPSSSASHLPTSDLDLHLSGDQLKGSFSPEVKEETAVKIISFDVQQSAEEDPDTADGWGNEDW